MNVKYTCIILCVDMYIIIILCILSHWAKTASFLMLNYEFPYTTEFIYLFKLQVPMTLVVYAHLLQVSK